MRFSKKAADEVREIISTNKLVSDRENKLIEKGFVIKECPMGSGGTGQIKTFKNEVRMQIGYGHGKHNYAKCVIFDFLVKI